MEVILSGAQAEKLKAEGLEPRPRRSTASPSRSARPLQAAAGFEVWKQYDEIKADFEKMAKKYLPLAERLVNLGKSVRRARTSSA